MKHALALVLLAALNLGLYGRLYSPLDHAYPEGEAASASVTRFIAENPNPWGWNPMWDGGQPTQTTALPAFHYLAAALSKLGPIPIQAHRIVAVTMALFLPLALYAMLVAFGLQWGYALAASMAAAILTPIRLFTDSTLSFLPANLEFLELTGDAPFAAGVTLLVVALTLVWRAAHDRGAGSLFIASLSMALVALTNGTAALILTLALLMLELTMLGIAGEYRYSHRRVLLAMIWAYLLSCFWLTPGQVTALFHWPSNLPWISLCLGGILIRLLFLGRRDVLLCFATLSLWAIGLLARFQFDTKNKLVLSLFLLIFVSVWAAKGLSQEWIAHRAFGVALVLCLLLVRFEPHGIYWLFPFPNLDLQQAMQVERMSHFSPRLVKLSQLKVQLRQWRGDWGMRPPSSSDEFKLTRWLVEHPPRGRVRIENLPLRRRLNAWVPFAQTQTYGGPDSEYEVIRRDRAEFPFAFRTGNLFIVRGDFKSMAATSQKLPLDLRWVNDRQLKVTGTLPKDQTITVRVKYHPDWHVDPVMRIHSDDLGMMTLGPPPGPVNLDLTFHGTREQHIFGYASAAAWILSLGYVAIESIRRKRA